MVSYVIQVWQAAGGVVRWKHSPNNHQHYSAHTNTTLQTPPKPKHTLAHPSMHKHTLACKKTLPPLIKLLNHTTCWMNICPADTGRIVSTKQQPFLLIKGSEYIQKKILNISKVWKALSILKMQKTLPYSIGDQYFSRCQLLNFQMVKASVTPVDTKFKPSLS